MGVIILILEDFVNFEDRIWLEFGRVFFVIERFWIKFLIFFGLYLFIYKLNIIIDIFIWD